MACDTTSIYIDPLAAPGIDLQFAYDNGTGATPEIIIDAVRGPVTIQDAAAPTGGNFFEVNDSGGATTVFSVDATGATVDGKLTVTGLIDPTGLVLDEQATVPGGAPAAGQGTIWVENTSPNRLVFTNDVGSDSPVIQTLQDVHDATPTPRRITLESSLTNEPIIIRGNSSGPRETVLELEHDTGVKTHIFNTEPLGPSTINIASYLTLTRHETFGSGDDVYIDMNTGGSGLIGNVGIARNGVASIAATPGFVVLRTRHDGAPSPTDYTIPGTSASINMVTRQTGTKSVGPIPAGSFVSLPVTFPSGFAGNIPGIIATEVSGVGTVFASAGAVTTGGFTLIAFNAGGVLVPSATIFYEAIGIR